MEQKSPATPEPEPLRIVLGPAPGLLQMVVAIWVPERNEWAQTRTSISSHRAINVGEEIFLTEARMRYRALRKLFEREGLDWPG